MKKILSLVLAVLMLASMAVSTSAVNILNSEGTGFIKTNKDDKVSVSDLLEILNYKLPYGGAFNYKGDTVYSWWYDDCPECDGFSFHYVSGGKVNWKCLESKCGKTGVIEIEQDDDDKDDDTCTDAECTKCGSDDTLFVKTVEIFTGELCNRYFCLDCKEYFYTKVTELDDNDIADYVKCYYCKDIAEYDYLFVSDGKLYARYECEDGHVTDKRIYAGYDFDYDEYSVRVITTRGGDYDITGGSDAYYGETKTIEFYPNKGYVLTDVLVNGESVYVGSDNEIDITVKKNTVVHAYFEKASSLKNYTITAEAEGNGTITAKKNDTTVSSDKVTANYTDTVTYKFVPASKNYVISSVKVNGKSVGKVTSYTVSKLAGNVEIEVEFSWKNPFTDVKDSYANAVEYVTEAGIMSAAATANNKTYFSGNVKVSVQTFAAALAEMADTADKLDTVAERIEWADKYDLIDSDDDLSVTCDVQTACALVRSFLEALEDINDIDFEDLNAKDSVKETAIEIGLVTATTYEKNRNLNRYDLASVCYLVAGLEYDD